MTTDPADRYAFSVTTDSGLTITWPGLSLYNAKKLKSITDKAWPETVKRAGWELTPTKGATL